MSEVGKMWSVYNGYEPIVAKRSIVCKDLEDAKQRAMEIISVRAHQILQIDDEKFQKAIKQADDEKKVKIEILSLYREKESVKDVSVSERTAKDSEERIEAPKEESKKEKQKS